MIELQIGGHQKDLGGGFRVRRLSDGSVLPGCFAASAARTFATRSVYRFAYAAS